MEPGGLGVRTKRRYQRHERTTSTSALSTPKTFLLTFLVIKK